MQEKALLSSEKENSLEIKRTIQQNITPFFLGLPNDFFEWETEKGFSSLKSL